MSKLKDDYKTNKEKLENMEAELVKCRSQIGIISESYLKDQMEYMIKQRKINQKQTKCEDILKECKVNELVKEISTSKYL